MPQVTMYQKTSRSTSTFKPSRSGKNDINTARRGVMQRKFQKQARRRKNNYIR